MTAEILWSIIPTLVLTLAVWVALPLWMVLRRPDRNPSETRTLPAYLQHRDAAAALFPAQRTARADAPAQRRELVSAVRN